ncbi:MAG: L-histidine N(alpha)-methyltransferase [Planctomycetota bacterium]
MPAIAEKTLLQEVLESLASDRPHLPCKLLYDDAGSELFEQICAQPEYYQTRTEQQILRDNAESIADEIGSDAVLVEYGAGSGVKTETVLAAMRDCAGYVPIDISQWMLDTCARRLHTKFPDLAIETVRADYTKPVGLPDLVDDAEQVVAFFPGGTIGNFVPEKAERFLANIAETVGRGGGLIVGFDLRKDPLTLHAAYNDAAGITAAFNLNLLTRLNQELDADFDTSLWRHYAPYNPGQGRIEMHLVALAHQTVSIAGERFHFRRGESIHTENSYKYTRPGFAEVADNAGWNVAHAWVDEDELFSVEYLTAR